jgi:hypothetical protein
LLVQTQDRVAGGHFDGGKQRHWKSPWFGGIGVRASQSSVTLVHLPQF